MLNGRRGIRCRVTCACGIGVDAALEQRRRSPATIFQQQWSKPSLRLVSSKPESPYSKDDVGPGLMAAANEDGIAFHAL